MDHREIKKINVCPERIVQDLIADNSWDMEKEIASLLIHIIKSTTDCPSNHNRTILILE